MGIQIGSYVTSKNDIQTQKTIYMVENISCEPSGVLADLRDCISGKIIFGCNTNGLEECIKTEPKLSVKSGLYYRPPKEQTIVVPDGVKKVIFIFEE